MPITMPLAFTRLWGLDGTIMNLLDAVLPGSKLFVTLIVFGMMCLFAYFFINEVKDPFKNIKEIMSIMAALGGCSLLLFGNMFVLVALEMLLILVFIGGRYAIKKAESTPAGAESALQGVAPEVAKKLRADDAAGETVTKQLSPKDAKTASETQKLGHDLNVLEKDTAAMAAISKETAAKVAELAKADMTAEQREAGMYNILQQHTQQIKTDLGKAHSTVGAEQQARQQMNSFLGVFEQDCKLLVENETTILKNTADNAANFLQHVKVLGETAKRASEIEWIIEKTLKELKRADLGTTTIMAMTEKAKALRKQASGLIDVAAQAALENEATAIDGMLTQAEALKTTFLNTIQALQAKLNELKPLNAPLKNTKGKLHADEIKKAATLLLPLEKPIKGYSEILIAKIQELQKSQEPPENYGKLLIPPAHQLFDKLIESRQKRNAFNETLKKTLIDCANLLTQETAISAKIAEIQALFAQTQEALAALNDKSQEAINKKVEEFSLQKARQTLYYINEEKRNAIQTLLSDAQRGITATLQIIDQEIQSGTQALENAKRRHETIIQNLREMSNTIAQEQTKIIKLQEVKLQKAQAETEAAFKKAKAA